jgi:hypothetical protein
MERSEMNQSVDENFNSHNFPQQQQWCLRGFLVEVMRVWCQVLKNVAQEDQDTTSRVFHGFALEPVSVTNS